MGCSCLFQNATIVDGTGRRGHRGDVLVTDGVIAEVSDCSDAAPGMRIDADGLVLCPGFIDIHSHADFTIGDNNLGLNLVAQGITTVIAGNCGSSAAPALGEMARYRRRPGRRPWEGPLDEWMTHLEEGGLGLDLGILVGQGTVRGSVMGPESTEPATDDEIRAMRELVRESMDAGAFGMSTGRDYVPGCYAEPDEIVAVGGDLSRYPGAFYACHLLDEAWELLGAINEAVDIAGRLDVPVQLAHHKSMIPDNWGRVENSLGLVDELVEGGREIRLDVYPYTFAAAMGLTALLPPWFTENGPLETARRMKNRECFDRLTTHMREGYPGWKSSLGDFRWGYTVLQSPGKKEWEGRTVGQLARELGVDPLEVIRELVIADGEDTVCAFTMDEKDVKRILQHPRSSICTDAPALDPDGTVPGVVHPRTFGTYPRLLGTYVREEGTLSLEEAVHKATGLPAGWLGLADRGRIRPGARADIVLFDPDAITDRSTLDDPLHYPDGIEWVLVAGVPVVQEGQLTRETPGAILRR